MQRQENRKRVPRAVGTLARGQPYDFVPLLIRAPLMSPDQGLAGRRVLYIVFRVLQVLINFGVLTSPAKRSEFFEKTARE
jgi:hypothetical protein